MKEGGKVILHRRSKKERRVTGPPHLNARVFYKTTQTVYKF